ncbi:MAG: hypothetical protein H3C43_02880 [Leptonema sp. (in: Bacteria)]|nr:hypothetical protein [Leptonema sp. (in: bacteria)]
MKNSSQISRSQLEELILQNQKMRELLQEWPARKLMMGYEKDWNLKREEFFLKHPKLTIDQAAEKE